MTSIEPEHKHVVVSKQLVLINSLSSVVTRFLNITVLLWMYQYLLTRVPAEEFAVYPVVTAIIVVAPLFFSFFTGGVSRYIVDAYARGDFPHVQQIFSSVIPMLLALGVLFLTLGGFFSWHIGDFLNIPPSMLTDARIMMFLLIIGATANLVLLPFSTGFHVKQRFVELNLIGVVRDLVRLGLIFIFLMAIGAEVLWVVVATVLAEFVHLALIVTRSRSLLPELRMSLASFEWATATRLISFGLWTTLGHLGNIMYTSAATIVLNKFGTGLDVTNYHLGATLFRQMQGTLSVALVPLQPPLTAMHALSDRTRISNAVVRGGRYTLWASLLVACPLAIYSNEFVHLYLGPKFEDASMIIVLFMIIFPFTQPTALLPLTAMASGELKPFFLPAFAAQLLGLMLMILLTGWWDLGAIGATASLTIITVGSQLAYFWWLTLRLAYISKERFRKEVLALGLAPAISGCAAWALLGAVFAPDSWPSLFFCAVSGASIYLAVLLGFCLNRTEARQLHSIISTSRHRLGLS